MRIMKVLQHGIIGVHMSVNKWEEKYRHKDRLINTHTTLMDRCIKTDIHRDWVKWNEKGMKSKQEK